MNHKGERIRNGIILIFALVGFLYVCSLLPSFLSFIAALLPKMRAHLEVHFWSYIYYAALGFGGGVLILFITAIISSVRTSRILHYKLIQSPCASCARAMGKNHHHIPGTEGDPNCRNCHGSGKIYDSDELGSWTADCTCSIYYPSSYVCDECYTQRVSYAAFNIKPIRRLRGSMTGAE